MALNLGTAMSCKECVEFVGLNVSMSCERRVNVILPRMTTSLTVLEQYFVIIF